MTDYSTTRESFGRPEKVLDVQAFARDLAAAMGGTYNEPKSDDMGAASRYATFDLDDCEIGVTRSWSNRWDDKVVINIGPRDLVMSYNETPHGDDYKLPSASVSTSRPMATLVKDIRRRVVEPAKAPIAKRREYHAELKRKAATLVERAEGFRKYRGLDVKVENGATHSGTLYMNGGGVYLSGRFYADGTVSIDRLGTIKTETFEGILAALAGERKEEDE